MSFAGQTWWLVGASEGLGGAMAELMAGQGARVIVSARDSERLHDLAANLADAEAVPMDVTDEASVRRATEEIGPVDGLIYLAGAYWPMRTQEYDGDKVITMLDVNLLGAARVLNGVLPQMLARGTGHIVLTGSLAGYRGLPGAVGYGASKAGLMHLAESLHADLRGSGLRVQQINPGFIRTRLTEKNTFSMPFILDADEAAKRMFAIMQSGRFKGDFPTLFSWLFRIGRVLPGWLYDRIFARTA